MGFAVFTIGHSNQPREALIGALVENDIQLLLDVRRFPHSRRNPQFNLETLGPALREHGIEYRHAESLGGRREAQDDSRNLALRDAGFRGFADYMGSDSFERALDELLHSASHFRSAIMCAEALPWRCHRSLIADALAARGVEVFHLVGGASRQHRLSPLARADVIGGRVTYPALV